MKRGAVGAVVGTVLVTATVLGGCSHAPASRPGGAKQVTVNAGGRTLAVVTLGEGKTAVIMLHGLTTHKDVWYPIMAKLAAAAGFASYAFDYDTGPDAGAPADALTAVSKYARAHGATSIVLMGSSLGAGFVQDLGVSPIRAVVSLSAVRQGSAGVPVLAIASEHDGQTAALAHRIATAGVTGSQELIVSGSTHGADLIHPHPEVAGKIIAWLRSVLAS